MGSKILNSPLRKTNNLLPEDVLEEGSPSDDEGGCHIGEVYIPPPPPVIKKFKTKGQPRLSIHLIEMNNFKSYSGTQTLGPFCKSFNAIIGPNGSGKSNVIDAMLFVFGSRASRIRCTNNQSLIHNSEVSRSNESCTVTVHFVEIVDRTGDEYDTVPGSELRITRTAYSYNNISYYYVNERQVAFREIAKLLKKHGVDLINNRFLILQGQVEQISQLPCKGKTPRETGLLEYLEEIIGTHRYIGPLTQLRQLIDHNEAEKEQRLERLNTVRTSVEALAADLDKCLVYLRKENAVVTMQHQIAQVHLAGLRSQEAGCGRKRQEKETQVDELRRRVQDVEATVSTKQCEVDEVQAGLSDVTQALLRCEDAIRENVNRITSYEAANKEIKKKLSRYKSEFGQENSKEKRARELPATNQTLIAAQEKDIVALEAAVKVEEKRLEATVATIADATKELKEEKDRLQTQQMELSRKFNEAKSEYDLALSQLSVYTSTEVECKQKLGNLRASLEDMSTRYEASKERMEQLQASLPALESKRAHAEKTLKSTGESEQRAMTTLRKLQGEAAELTYRMQRSSSRSQLIDFVMQLKMSGAVSGILGRLGDLGAIDEAYDVAVSTSCGSALDHIVVETVECGQAVLAQVKRANVGRVFIMALDQMGQYARYTGPVKSTPGNLQRLFDLIRVEDERVKPAMYYATSNTLVSPSLDKAMQVGYGHHMRVVTLEGAIIEPSGIMSGGGRTLIRGKMGRCVQIATDADASSQTTNMRKIHKLEEDLTKLTKKKVEEEAALAEIKKTMDAERRELQKLSIDIPSLESNVPALLGQIRVLEAELERVRCDPKQVKKLTEDVRRKKTALDRCGEQAKKLELKVAKVHEEIMEVSSGKTSAIKKSLAEAERKWTKAKSELNNLRVEIKRAERDVITCGQRAASLHEEMTKLGKASLDNNEHIDIYREQIDGLIKEKAEKEAELDSKKAEASRTVREMAKLSAWRDKEEALLETVSRELRTVRYTHEEYLTRVQHATDALAEIQLKPLPVMYDLEEVFANAADFEEKPDVTEELVTLSPEELAGVDTDSLETQIKKLDNELKFLDFNESRIEEYKKKMCEYAKRCREMQAVLATLNTYSAGYEQCISKRQKEFDTNFVKISKRVQECYQMLTFGGKADLEYKEYSDPYAQGIKYVVRPPRKSWKSIDCLSGGEKTLASLALVFALHYYAPSPLYFLDEIDAALDTPNVAIIGHFIRTRTRFAQFIIISLRHEMFELATNLIGIWKVKNCTKSLTITKEICKKAATVDDGELMVDIDESEEEDEAEDEMVETSSQPKETEETLTVAVGPGTGVPGSGEDTELEDMDDDVNTAVDTEDDAGDDERLDKRGKRVKEKRNKRSGLDDAPDTAVETEEDGDDDGVDERVTKKQNGRRKRGRKESVGQDVSEKKRGQKRKEGGASQESDRETSRGEGRPELSGHTADSPVAVKRLRVRGVKQINDGPLPSPVHVSALQRFIRKQRKSTDTPTGAEENGGGQGTRRGRRTRSQNTEEETASPMLVEGTADEDDNDEGTVDEGNGDATAAGQSTPVRSRRHDGRRKSIVPDSEGEDSDQEFPIGSDDVPTNGDDDVETNVEEELDAKRGPRKRGRQRKGIVVEKRKKKRGIRINTLSDDEISQEEVVEDVPKRRGRPRKQRMDYNTEDDEMSQEEDVNRVPKRKGRRPKKKTDNVEFDADAELSQEEDAEDTIEKRRGRKPKHKVEYNTEEEAHVSQEDLGERMVKNKGRKPKQRIDYNTEDEMSQEEDVEERVESKRGRRLKKKFDYNTEEEEESQMSQDESVKVKRERGKRGRKR